jgi:hypothetical protein
MNLGQLRERVEDELQHAPNVQAFKNQVRDKMNEVFLEFILSDRWAFRLVEKSMRVYADQPLGVLGAGTTCQVLANSTSSVRPGPAGSAIEVTPYSQWDGLVYRTSDPTDSLRRYGRISGPFPFGWRTAFGFGDGMALGGAPDPDFTVNQTGDVWLDAPPLAGQGSFTDLMVRRDRYQLPFDCGEVVALISRDDRQGEVELVNRTAERRALLSSNQDAPGRPSAWVLDDPVDGGNAPRKVMTGAASLGGSLQQTTTYRYFYAWYHHGTYSGKSNIVSVTTTGVNRTITLSNLEVESNIQYGRRRHVWVDEGDGVFKFIGEVTPGSATFVDNGTAGWGATGRADIGLYPWRERYAAPRLALRLWPRPAEDQWMQLVYLQVPDKMVNDQDVPSMPEEIQPYLIHATAAQLAAKYASKEVAAFNREEAKRYRTLAVQKYITRYNSNVRQSWSPLTSKRGGPPPRITFVG